MKKQVLVYLLFFFIIVLTVCIGILIKSNHSINFDNEKYILQYAKTTNNGRIVLNEYTRKNDPIQRWKQLISINYYPYQKDSIVELSDYYIENLQKTYGDKFKLLSDNKKGQVIIKSYIIVNRDYTEYNAVGFTQYKEAYYYMLFQKKYEYSNVDELKEQSMKLLRENSKYTGLIELKVKNNKPAPLLMTYEY